MAGIFTALANGAKAMTGASSQMGGLLGGMQNLNSLSAAFGNLYDSPQVQTPKNNPLQQPQNTAPVLANPSVSARMAQSSEWEEMMKKLISTKQQNTFGSWLER